MFAFVGAGFSAPAVPQWWKLLDLIADNDTLEPETADRVRRLVAKGTSKDLEASAQILRDELGPKVFESSLRSALGTPELDDRMHARLESLLGIPFRAILTTTFDGILDGRSPGRDAYLDVLRPTGHRWWDQRFWNPSQGRHAVVNLHGSAAAGDDIVFTRQDYRRRLYDNPGYVTFLRSVMATTTVLYLGFSFTDAYLDELRSEILALLAYEGGDRPIAYALLNDATPDEVEYARRHEGIEILSFPSDPDFRGFDDTLAAIHELTNPTRTLGRLLHGKRIVWIDPASDLVGPGMEFLEQAASSSGANAAIDRFDSADEALDSIKTDGADLVVTRWGCERSLKSDIHDH